MHVHCVYFWLKKDLAEDAFVAFEDGLNSLLSDPAVKSGFYGKPADTHRSVVDNSYTYGLILVFDDLAGHDSYQAGPVHTRFIDNHGAKWERSLVYDTKSM